MAHDSSLMIRALEYRLGHTIDPDSHPAGHQVRLRAESGPATLDELIDAATVKHTAFFRHPLQFQELHQYLVETARSERRPVRIWSAGCATGEEPYSIALTAFSLGIAFDVLATDVSRHAIEIAKRGNYGYVAGNQLAGYAIGVDGVIPDPVKDRVRFDVRSLVDLDPACGHSGFDIIFCRNVLIYFTRAAATAILERLSWLLAPNGYIVVAPSEVLIPTPPHLVSSGERFGWLRRVDKAIIPAIRPPKVSILQEPTPKPLQRAGRALSSGSAAEAEHLLRAQLEESPNDPAVWFLLGEVLATRDEPTQARIAFERACACAAVEETEEALSLLRGAQARIQRLGRDP